MCKIYLILLVLVLFNINSVYCKEKINPQAFKLCEMAVQLAREGKYDNSVIYLKRALDIQPKFEEALFNLGTIYRIQKRYDDSYSSLQQLLLKNPTDEEARLEKVLTLIAMNNLKEARIELDKVSPNQNRYSAVEKKLNKAMEKTKQEITNNIKTFSSKGLYTAEEAQNNIIVKTPTGIAEDDEKNIYLLNFSENIIERILLNGEREIFAKEGLLSGPSSIVFDKSNDVFLVSNYKSGNIIKVNKFGKMSSFINNLNKPYALFISSNNKLYVSEQGKNAISILNLK